MPPRSSNGAVTSCRPSKDFDRMTVHLPTTLRQRLVEADDHRCAYCGTSFENLCFACYRCNLFKGSQVVAIDPLSGEMAPLFHARRDRWDEHFAWDEAGLRIVGVTPSGRATVVALKMNNDIILDARRNWVRLGWRPEME